MEDLCVCVCVCVWKSQRDSEQKEKRQKNQKHCHTICHRILKKHHIHVPFRLINTLRQKLVHHKDKAPVPKQINVVYAKVERPSLNRGGSLRHHLSVTYNAVLSSLPVQLNTHSHLDPPSPNDPH